MQSLPLKGSRKTNTYGLVQKKRNSSALAMVLRLSCINPSIYTQEHICHVFLIYPILPNAVIAQT